MQDLSHLDTLPDSALVSIPVFAKLTGQGVSTVWRKLADHPQYPKPIKLSARCTRVKLGDVRRLLAEGV